MSGLRPGRSEPPTPPSGDPAPPAGAPPPFGESPEPFEPADDRYGSPGGGYGSSGAGYGELGADYDRLDAGYGSPGSWYGEPGPPYGEPRYGDPGPRYGPSGAPYDLPGPLRPVPRPPTSMPSPPAGVPSAPMSAPSPPTSGPTPTTGVPTPPGDTAPDTVDAAEGRGSGHRRAAAGLRLTDLGFSIGLLLLAYGITLAIWFLHRKYTGVEAGESTSQVVITGALFGSVSALSDAFFKASRGRLWAAIVGIGVGVAGTLALTPMFGAADGTVTRDAVIPILVFAIASLSALLVLAARSAAGRNPRDVDRSGRVRR